MRVNVGSIELEVQVSGNGPDVLLVHGYPDTHACWHHQVVALTAAGYRTIAPDLRGLGASDKPADVGSYARARHVADLIGVLDHLGAERAHLVGHDMGSSILQRLAVGHPERARSLACLSVGHAGALLEAGLPQRRMSWYMLLFQIPGIAEQWLSRDEFRNLREWLGRHPDPDEVVDRMRDPHALTSGLALYRAALPPETLLASPSAVPPLPVPAMGIWSSDDDYLTEESMTGTARYAAVSWRYERLDRVGHWLQLEAPDRVNELLLNFLASY